MRRDLFDYELPPELVASHPSADRDAARLLVVGPDNLEHHTIRNLPDLLPEGSLVVVNDTRVLRARLLGQKLSSGGKVEIFLVRKLGKATVSHDERSYEAETWQALGKSSKPLRPGALVAFGEDGALLARIGERAADGTLDVALFSLTNLTIADAIDLVGHVPLPPYVKRSDEAEDRTRYQTVYAREPGAVAAPTAGLHLTETLLDRMRSRRMEIARVTLHVGLGTFQPVTADDLDDHPMHTETFSVPAETEQAIARARARGADVVAIGTTSVRALESAADPERPGFVKATHGDTRLLIQPGYRFRIVDRLLTNFHLPQSTLLALVAAFSGLDRVLAAYRAAVQQRYRFFSYGDAMLLRRSE
ncbi:MAG: tRNA preQ1(34) S-adenosylmethionine ribosyltransferase-isomerase QueA [Polyangiaceae bacterium]|nr:tRNA preQ1(34) S-adenosylmethionine ribosyltransferase-isomerase QueA [Polyangiaceae bacterium]